jgi:hypothetical protein
MAASRLLAGAGAAAFLYGGAVGLHAAPRGSGDTEHDASLGTLAVNTVRDTAIAVADDITLLPLLEIAKKKLPSQAGLFGLAQKAIVLGGGAIAGAIMGHDAQNFFSARAQLAASQAQNPDRRINPIEGFRNKGPGGQQRTTMTGIASPAAGGIAYRMWNNPFADMLNRAIADPGSQTPQDPRVKALGYSYFGGLLGTALGARGGLARATTLGLTGGVLGGLYGMHEAHNPDLRENVGALGEIAIGAAPTLGVAGLLYGLSSARLGKFGGLVQAGLNKFGVGAGKAALALVGGAQRTSGWGAKVGLATKRLHDASDAYWAKDPWLVSQLSTQMTARFGVATGKEFHLNDNILNLSQRVIDSTGRAIEGSISAAHGLNAGLAIPMLAETSKADGRWAQSLGAGHLLTIIPHTIAVGAAAQQLHASHERKHATNTMPSNRRR